MELRLECHFKKKLDRVSSEVNYDVCMRASILFPVHISDTYTITQFFVRPSVLWLTCFKQSSSHFSYPPLSLLLLFCISPFLSPSLNYSPIRSLQLSSPYLSVFQFESQSISSPSFITCLNSIELSLSLLSYSILL